MTFQELHRKARKAAYNHVFCNVDGSHWPVDPEGFLTKAVLARLNASDISNYREGTDGEIMEVQEIYEDWSVFNIVDLLDDITVAIVNEFRGVAA